MRSKEVKDYGKYDMENLSRHLRRVEFKTVQAVQQDKEDLKKVGWLKKKTNQKDIDKSMDDRSVVHTLTLAATALATALAHVEETKSMTKKEEAAQSNWRGGSGLYPQLPQPSPSAPPSYDQETPATVSMMPVVTIAGQLLVDEQPGPMTPEARGKIERMIVREIRQHNTMPENESAAAYNSTFNSRQSKTVTTSTPHHNLVTSMEQLAEEIDQIRTTLIQDQRSRDRESESEVRQRQKEEEQMLKEIERMNRTLKEKLSKIVFQTKLNWVQALPLALLSVRQTVNKTTGFAPFELITGRVMPGPSGTIVPYSQIPIPDLSHHVYWNQLHSLACSLSSQVASSSADPAAPPPDPLWTHVYLKVLSRKWSEPRWTGPFKVTARTTKAVQLESKGSRWYHFSQIRPADPPSA